MMYAILICALFAVWVLGFIAIIAFIKHEEWGDKGRWAEIILLLAWPALIAMGICLGCVKRLPSNRGSGSRRSQ